jgi:broad specificity phosphatase PhoE
VLARLHLVRHGEVFNPQGLVYADLPGFPLSELGRAQAVAAAEHLAASGITVVATSPLQRARETAGFIGRRLGVEPMSDPGLTEWGLSMRWAGEPWLDLERRFPGEATAYAADPADLPFAPESLAEVAGRMTAVVTALGKHHPGAVAAVVSHQDPIHALRRILGGDGFASFHTDKPVHAAVITLDRQADRWIETGSWAPDTVGAPFPPPTADLVDGR